MCRKAVFNRQQGFTLIELVVVIVILGILAVTALPKFINLSKEARTNVLEQISVSVKVANDLMHLKSKMPSYSTRPVSGRDDLLDIDMDNNGTFDINGDVDIRLKWSYLDNTDILKRVDLSDDFLSQEEGIDYTYVGYDFNNNGQVKDDACYFSYTQAQNATTPPVYEVINTQC